MDRDHFTAEVRRALEPYSSTLTHALRQLIASNYPKEVVCIAFEVFPQSFTMGFPIRAFFLDEHDTEFFLFENGKAVYPSPIDPGLLSTDKVYDESLEEELELADPEADSHTLASLTAIHWFEDCWIRAGGRNFDLDVTINIHDSPESYDLRSRQWRAP